jgi:phage shock protein A
MAEHLDLEGMSHRDAQQYVTQYVAALKEVQRKRAQAKAEFDKWEQRARLAQEKGRSDLEEQAMAQCRDIAHRYESLGEEERQLDTDVQVLKQNLKKLQQRPERSVDTEALLQQLTHVTGESPETTQTNEQVSDLEIDDELARLKEQVRQGDAEDSPGKERPEHSKDREEQ